MFYKPLAVVLSIACLILGLSMKIHAQILLQTSTFTKEQDSLLVFYNGKNEKVLSLLADKFIAASSYSQSVKAKFGTYHFNESKRKDYAIVELEAVQQFGSSFFLSGFVGNSLAKFPFEVGVFLNDTFAKRFWVSVKITDSTESINSIIFTVNTDAKHFYGFGEQFSRLDFAGKRLNNFTEENGIGRGDMPVSKLTKFIGVSGEESSTYFPLPTFFTEKGHAISVKPTTITFDFTQAGSIAFEVEACSNGGKCLFNIYADTTAELLKPTHHYLPDWAYGTVLGLQGGAIRVEQIVDAAIAAKNPVTAVWIQDWVGRRKVSFGSRLWWKWEADEALYPNMKDWIGKMNQKGVKVLGYINPFIIKESRWYEEAVSKNYLVKNKHGKDYKVKAGGFDAYMLDLANPAACEWFKAIIKTELIENGFHGWMADFAEWLPIDAQLHNGFSGKEFHNFYPVAWARINREAAIESGVDDSLVIFHRSGNEGSQQYVKMLWTGDQTPDFGLNDGFPSAVKAILSSAASGVLYNHSDIGGYTNVDFGSVHIHRNRELLYRWIEFETFTPFFRTHEGLKPEKNIQVYSDSSTIQFFAKFGRIHYALKDYMQAAIKAENGQILPLIRPLFFHPSFELFEHQFLLGNDVLIAPVVTSGTEKMEVKLPEGNWQYAWKKEMTIKSNELGTVVSVDVPLGKPAVFIRQYGKWTDALSTIFEREN